MNNYKIRLYQNTTTSVVLSSIANLTISGITIVSKTSKFEDICLHKGNQKKFGYTVELSKPFNKISGSNSTPTLTFKGQYIDIILKNFPRYPVFTQEYYAAKYALKGHGYTNWPNKGYPLWLKYRPIEISKI